MSQGLPVAPAAERNKEVIGRTLQDILQGFQAGTLLEVASGTGQHAAHGAGLLSPLVWQPTERDSNALAAIDQWGQDAALAQPAAARPLDLLTPNWWQDWQRASPPVIAILAINLIHIAPWSVSEALFEGAGGLLTAGGLLVLYGPMRYRDDYGAESNWQFDQWLKAKDPAYGIRDVTDLIALARQFGLILRDQHTMPANNDILVFERQGD